MKHLAAYLLLGLGGNTSPSAKDIKAVLESVGVDADSDRLDTLLKELKGKDINEVGFLERGDNVQSNLETNHATYSLSPRVLPSSLPFPLAALVAVLPLPVVLLLAAPLLTPRLRLPRRRRRRSPTRTWVSVFSTKQPHDYYDDGGSIWGPALAGLFVFVHVRRSISKGFGHSAWYDSGQCVKYIEGRDRSALADDSYAIR